jgi:hypothetical protein
MSHAPQGGQAPDQASSGRQTGAAVPLGQIIPKARNAASHLTSHKQHGDTNLATAPDRPTRRVSQSPEPVAEVIERVDGPGGVVTPVAVEAPLPKPERRGGLSLPKRYEAV